MAEFSAESIRQISRLATNSLRIGTGNFFSRTGNFLPGSGNFLSLLAGTQRSRATVHLLGRLGGALDMGGLDPNRMEFSVLTRSLEETTYNATPWLHTIERRQGKVVAVAIALDGRRAASVSWDRRV